MTPYRTGEIVGTLTGVLIVAVCLWLILVLATVLVGRARGRPVTVRGAAGNLWVLGIVAAVLILQILSWLGRR